VAAFLVPLLFVPCRADLIIKGTLITHSGHVVDTLASSLEIKGPLLRRSLEGKGTLSMFLGRRVEIVHRTAGTSTVLDLDAGTYTKSEGGPRICHPWYLFDLRWLGRAPVGTAALLVWPDTVTTILGQTAHAFEFRFPTRQKGGSTIRFWVVYELDSLFGADGARSLYCGVSEGESDRHVSADLAKQFGLTPESIQKLNQVRLGYPVRIESFMGQEGSRTELSRFETLAVERTHLADSLFGVPPSFRPPGSPDQR
jgi:hypothetical protein